jgi:DNA primase
MAVDDLFPDAVRAGDSYRSLCPAHNDRRPSLSIRVKDGRALVKCFAGCTNREIAEALGMSERELYAALEQDDASEPGRGTAGRERRR